jgi:muconolactone delta-isomerase
MLDSRGREQPRGHIGKEEEDANRSEQGEGSPIIHGGGYTAARGNVFVIEADSVEEVDQLVTSLPHWGLVQVDVKPLISHSTSLERARAMEQRLQERMR